MFQQIIDNAGTILVSLTLIGLVARILVRIRKDRKQGKTSCGCSCSNCPLSGCCHKSP